MNSLTCIGTNIAAEECCSNGTYCLYAEICIDLSISQLAPTSCINTLNNKCTLLDNIANFGQETTTFHCLNAGIATASICYQGGDVCKSTDKCYPLSDIAANNRAGLDASFNCLPFNTLTAVKCAAGDVCLLSG